MKYFWLLISLLGGTKIAYGQFHDKSAIEYNSENRIKHSRLESKQINNSVINPTYIKATNNKFEIKLRKSFESEDAKPEPALFSYTNPKENKSSILIDAAIAPTYYFENLNLTLSGIGEYHRNTLIDEEQNTLQGGFASEWWINGNFNSDSNPKNSYTGIVTSNVKYSNNRVDSIRSIIGMAEFTMLFTKSFGRWNNFLPNSNNNIGKVFFYEYFPTLGIEYENRFKAEEDSIKGNIFRGVGKLYLGIRPLQSLLNYRLEFFGDMQFRIDLFNTTELKDLYHPLIEVGINYLLIDKGSKFAKLSLSYNSGENPAQGLKNQKFILLSIKAKI